METDAPRCPAASIAQHFCSTEAGFPGGAKAACFTAPHGAGNDFVNAALTRSASFSWASYLEEAPQPRLVRWAPRTQRRGRGAASTRTRLPGSGGWSPSPRCRQGGFSRVVPPGLARGCLRTVSFLALSSENARPLLCPPLGVRTPVRRTWATLMTSYKLNRLSQVFMSRHIHILTHWGLRLQEMNCGRAEVSPTDAFRNDGRLSSLYSTPATFKVLLSIASFNGP